ncbi:helix-turn-helix domain-containing protein [Paenibacillus eucommiae]|uniref:AraC-like DNA-binding protein n=1 Tax=Paenibacillus eucommiae TaxID=1355755 RepID=A0ABS4IT88_9BACL|nr:AraC family transcriptional regulator [Paenibacillus eucommiae]MBP1990786.1 AraC-like DNA-binding protein [Paenibacillus eucommiae]
MPQNDRHRTRVVPIEYKEDEQLELLPLTERVTLVLVNSGSAAILINEKMHHISAPCVLCISPYIRIKIMNKHHWSAQAFSFNPTFLNSKLTFEALSINKFDNLEDAHDRNLLTMFLNHTDHFSGVLQIPSSMYLRILEWVSTIGTETFAQSDGMWTCRIRRYLLQCLFLIEDLYVEMSKNNFQDPPNYHKEPVQIALEFIHVNYQNEIYLNDLCQIVKLNRTSLNRQFKQQTGLTAMDYLNDHRIKIACETLVHTNLKISELAEACGFQYETYFIKKFKKKMEVSPSEYRKNEWNRLGG